MSSATFCCWQSSNFLSKWIIRQKKWFCWMKSMLIPFFCHAGEEFCHILSLIERVSKQQLLSTNHNDVSLRINSLESSRELTVRLCAAHLLRHIIAHVLALLFQQFWCFAKNLASCCDFAVHCRLKNNSSYNIKPIQRLHETPISGLNRCG